MHKIRKQLFIFCINNCKHELIIIINNNNTSSTTVQFKIALISKFTNLLLDEDSNLVCNTCHGYIGSQFSAHVQGPDQLIIQPSS